MQVCRWPGHTRSRGVVRAMDVYRAARARRLRFGSSPNYQLSLTADAVRAGERAAPEIAPVGILSSLVDEEAESGQRGG